jgi:hypothetical protein
MEEYLASLRAGGEITASPLPLAKLTGLRSATPAPKAIELPHRHDPDLLGRSTGGVDAPDHSPMPLPSAGRILRMVGLDLDLHPEKIAVLSPGPTTYPILAAVLTVNPGKRPQRHATHVICCPARVMLPHAARASPELHAGYDDAGYDV